MQIIHGHNRGTRRCHFCCHGTVPAAQIKIPRPLRRLVSRKEDHSANYVVGLRDSAFLFFCLERLHFNLSAPFSACRVICTHNPFPLDSLWLCCSPSKHSLIANMMPVGRGVCFDFHLVRHGGAAAVNAAAKHSSVFSSCRRCFSLASPTSPHHTHSKEHAWEL